MKEFIINVNSYLNRNVKGFYHTDYFGYGKSNNPDYLNTLKNDPHHTWSNYELNDAKTTLRNILDVDLLQILQTVNLNLMTICVVPRAKTDNLYNEKQLLFKSTVKSVIDELDGFEDGTEFIIRHKNTKTTHLRKPNVRYVNDGPDPYEGITNETCTILPNVRGKDILLIDDIYTKKVNIDEDVIQALLDKEAKSVVFYAVGKTFYKNR